MPGPGRDAAEAPDDATPVQERLLTAASRLFAERGFALTSVQEIVERAGVTKGAMYHYYASKDDLLQEIYSRLLAGQSDRLVAIADTPGLPVRERLRAAAADLVVSTLENLDDATVSWRSMHMLPPERMAQVRLERRRFHERFRALIEQGQAEGALRADISADLAAHQFFGGVHHLGAWYHADGELTPESIGETFADLLLRGLDDRVGPESTIPDHD
ncbi:TetR/AcrR family transcriptional regulator [Streptacidiphilus sp. N1-12]|uniref:TetR/AcrR family transcriptional regulator n=2 Tax=Streptacidiphilus alkalitolerans TaxID=3342712 RepID=A0ABV6WL49_9ACTN